MFIFQGVGWCPSFTIILVRGVSSSKRNHLLFSMVVDFRVGDQKRIKKRIKKKYSQGIKKNYYEVQKNDSRG